MSQISIQKQIEVIRQVTQEVCKTKEAARQFLIDAGIINIQSPTPRDIKRK